MLFIMQRHQFHASNQWPIVGFVYEKTIMNLHGHYVARLLSEPSQRLLEKLLYKGLTKNTTYVSTSEKVGTKFKIPPNPRYLSICRFQFHKFFREKGFPV